MSAPCPRCLPLAVVLGALSIPLGADQHVAITAFAKEEYTQRKFENGQPRTETYVFMQGKYFEGATSDRSIEKMPFRRIAEFLAPELAKQAYLPTKDATAADLLLVVHWGTTLPRVTGDEYRAVVSTMLDNALEKKLEQDIVGTWIGPDQAGLAPLLTTTGTEADRKIGIEQLYDITDHLDGDFHSASNSNLLGYTGELRRMGRSLISGAAEATLRSDLAGERYFVIVRAYDLKEKVRAERLRRAVWSIYMNIRSPGQNFADALNRMSAAASAHFGRATVGVQTAKVEVRRGKVDLAPVVILGEQK